MTRARIRRLVLVSLLAAAAIPLAACADDSAGPEVGADVEDVANDQPGVDPFLGNTVTVSGAVSSIISPTSFRLGGEDWSGEPLRVINAANANVGEDEAVQVTGVVREYEETAIESDYDITIDDGLLDDWADDHVLVAEQVEPLPATAPDVGSDG